MDKPLDMYYSTEIYHRELVQDDLSSPVYYDNRLCAVVKDVTVQVFQMGIPGIDTAEFTFHYNYDGDIGAALRDPTSAEFPKAYLALALSANGGWGHDNAKNFKPKTSY